MIACVSVASGRSLSAQAVVEMPELWSGALGLGGWEGGSRKGPCFVRAFMLSSHAYPHSFDHFLSFGLSLVYFGSGSSLHAAYFYASGIT